MKSIKRFSCCLTGIILVSQGYSAINPPDTSFVIHESVVLSCRNYHLQAERITNRRHDDSIVVLNVTGKDLSGFEKYTLETTKGEIYLLRFPNSNTVYLNSASSLSFNPQAPNFFYITRGEAFFEVNQNSKIYIDSELDVWALSGTALNVKYYESDPGWHTGLCIVRGRARAEIGKNGMALESGKMYTYINDDLKGDDIDTSDVKAWVEESFNYKAIPYHHLVSRIAAWYGKEPVFKVKINRSSISFNGFFYEPLAVILARLNEKRKKFRCYPDADKLIVEYY